MNFFQTADSQSDIRQTSYRGKGRSDWLLYRRWRWRRQDSVRGGARKSRN